MNKKITKYLKLILSMFLLYWSASVAANTEQPSYSVLDAEGDIEVREYAPMMVAEVEVTGERDKAINQGFRMIADYIFGNNTSQQKVAMTAPVIQQKSEKIAMTAPVLQQGENNAWLVRFVMPSAYNLETIPKPNNSAVKLRLVSAKRFAAIRFSGFATESNLSRHLALLNEFVVKRKLKVISQKTYAFYNPPWTLPFLRRNEILLEVMPK
jgi:effector-binding domain-containing protein